MGKKKEEKEKGKEEGEEEEGAMVGSQEAPKLPRFTIATNRNTLPLCSVLRRAEVMHDFGSTVLITLNIPTSFLCQEDIHA